MSSSPARRWRSVLGRVALAVFIVGCMVIVISGAVDNGPIDYRMVGTVAGLTMVISSVFLLPTLALRLMRTRTRTIPPLSPWRATALVAVGLAGVATVCVWRGVIAPWAPVATGTDAACPALERAGLSQAWPTVPRTRTRDDVDHNDLGVFSYCAWSADGDVQNSPFTMLNASVYLYEGTRLGTATGWAAGVYRDRLDEAMRSRALDGIGDEAFAAELADPVTVTARRANVLIQVEIYSSTADAARIAEDLVRRMAGGVRTS